MTLMIERRAYPRAAVSVDALLVPEGCAEGDKAEVLNLSRQGARIRLTAPVHAHAKVRLLLKSNTGWCPIAGRIVEVNEGTASLTFIALPTSAISVVDQLIATLASGSEDQPVAAPWVEPVERTKTPAPRAEERAAALPKKSTASGLFQRLMGRS
jgi:hypothetical protein